MREVRKGGQIKARWREAVAFVALLLRRTRENKLSVAAGYLTYNTLLAIVPLLMVVLAIFSAFPVFAEFSAEIKTFIYHNFSPNAGDLVAQYVDSFLLNTQKMSAVGTVGLVLVALLLVHSIDNTLNDIWRNSKKRSVLLSFTIYWTILTFGPVLLAMSLALNAHLMAQDWLLRGALARAVLGGLPFFFTWLTFLLIYLLVPNAKVRVREAAVGALFVASFFALGKKLFVLYINLVPTYQAIYGALATLPIMIVWLHLNWLMVLLGGQFCAVMQEWSNRLVTTAQPASAEMTK